jgi:CDGSH iron-sulfur domain-containing protein 3
MSIDAKDSPYALTLQAGRTVYICCCHQSATFPFCDGAHSAIEGAQPLAYTPEKDGTVYFCACGRSANMPLCDGSHNA